MITLQASVGGSNGQVADVFYVTQVWSASLLLVAVSDLLLLALVTLLTPLQGTTGKKLTEKAAISNLRQSLGLLMKSKADALKRPRVGSSVGGDVKPHLYNLLGELHVCRWIELPEA